MTEQEWLACADPKALLRSRGRSASRRKLRLFIVACWRTFYARSMDPLSQDAIEVAERFADQKATAAERLAAYHRVFDRGFPASIPNERVRLRVLARETALSATAPSVVLPALHTLKRVMLVRVSEQALTAHRLTSVFRDIINPFQPAAVHRSWRTAAVVHLAQSIYDDRQLPSGRFDEQKMSVLADALEDAGGDDAGILTHLRSAGPHVRGCWPVDLILGKS